MVKRMVFVLVALFFLSLSNLVGAEEPAKEKPLPTELPIVVVKGTDRSYLEVMRTRTLSFMPIRGEKSMIDYFLQVTLGKKTYSHSLSFPGLERRVEERVKERLPSAEGFAEGFIEERKEISPIVLLEPRLSRLSVSYTPARYITTRVKALSFMPIRGEKSLTEAFVQFPPRERAYRPLSKEESPLPYLYISSSLAAYDNFSYRLDYGRKKDKMIHFLSLGRYSAPQWTTYKKDGPALAKDEDWLNTRFIWDFGENKNALFSINGYQSKMDLPEEKERKKDKVDLAGELTFKLQGDNIFKVTGWAENTEVEGYKPDFNPGAQLELEIPQVPLNVGIRAENSSYADKSQFHLWIKDETIVFKRIKGLSAGLEVGIKKIEGVTSEVLPHLKLTEQFNPKLRLQVEAEREFYLPEFDDLYLSRDYIEINEELDRMVKLWNYEAQLKYELSSIADLSLGGFYNRGEDIIWNWDSANSLARPEIRNMSSLGAKLDLLLHVGEIFEQGISYTYQIAENLENLDDPGKVIPHYPQNMVDIWLVWSTGGWKINMEAEFVDERYYEENIIDDEIPSGWKQRFEISRMIGENLEFFIEFLLNNNYYLWKDYEPSAEKLYFGLKGKLY